MTYTWNLDKDAELWNNGEFDSIDKCLEQAKHDEALHYGETVYVAEIVTYVPTICAETILENLTEQAYECAGEAAEAWNPVESGKSAVYELEEGLQNTLDAWLEKYSQQPYFYGIDNIQGYKIT